MPSPLFSEETLNRSFSQPSSPHGHHYAQQLPPQPRHPFGGRASSSSSRPPTLPPSLSPTRCSSSHLHKENVETKSIPHHHPHTGQQHSPQRRLQLQELLAASSSLPPPLPSASPFASFASSTSSLPTPPPVSTVSASIFSTSTAAFLQSRPLPAFTPYPSPSVTPSATPRSTSPVRGTPPRSNPSSIIKDGLAASLATILSSPEQYNPTCHTPPPTSPLRIPSANPTPLASQLSSNPSGLTFIRVSGSSTTIITPHSETPITATPQQRRTSTPSSLSPSLMSPFSPSPRSSPSSSSSTTSEDDDSPRSSRTPTRPLNRSAVGGFLAGPAFPNPLSSLMMAVSEAMAEAAPLPATLSSLLRLLLEFTRADDVKLVSRHTNLRWNVDAHARSASASTLPQSAASASRYPTAMSLLDPHSILYDPAPVPHPELPLSVLTLVTSTSSMLTLSPPSIAADPVLAADPFFTPPLPGSSVVVPTSLLALPVLVGGRLLGVLLLSSEVRADGFAGVDVPALQVVSSACALMLERRGEERRRVEWERMAEECNKLKAELRQARKQTLQV